MDYPRMFERRPVERFILRAAPRWFEAILPISEPLGVVVRRQTRARITVVRSGLPRAELFFDQPRLPQPARPEGARRQIFYVGDDRPRKGLEEFLRAAEIVAEKEPDAQFAIGAKTPCLIHTSAPYEFYLRPSDRQLSELYRSSEVFVSASWAEGLGYPPLEAMACGTPVVLTDSQGVRDFARHGENCLMVAPRDPVALADAILRLLHEPALAARLAKNGPPTARQYDWEQMVDLVEETAWQLLYR
jgi:glycosyltransferase involved in cell wall biosynthesis